MTNTKVINERFITVYKNIKIINYFSHITFISTMLIFPFLQCVI